ncbi:uncharacterized protein LOC125494960 [Beta vulgaris subsp. vulgaris]|uniref:uncharacterized protein LOC125494960 n=1 Tax=Beta vulgaris subsp. vulgaris TaxID=3555 RepID=UPI00203727EB|nr:uncharacterized protein LOC125494960 [Beta vulgaris subsp. vulgaris]
MIRYHFEYAWNCAQKSCSWWCLSVRSPNLKEFRSICSSFGSNVYATTGKENVDIGARARHLCSHLVRRRWIRNLLLNNFQVQLVFYVTPSEALQKFNFNPSPIKFQLGGLVLEGSVHQPASSPEMEFVITDLMTDILVSCRSSSCSSAAAILPALVQQQFFPWRLSSFNSHCFSRVCYGNYCTSSLAGFSSSTGRHNTNIYDA